MLEFQFEALGTAWCIVVDDFTCSQFPDALKEKIYSKTEAFDQQLSRFISTSEVNKFRNADAGEYIISSELLELLSTSVDLRKLTKGLYDPAIGGLLEQAGYDSNYSFRTYDEEVKNWKLPEWSVNKNKKTVLINGPVVFDIGGIGKGYWIDVLSQLLITEGFPYHLVDGGGDMMATTKDSGEGWQIAIEWPGKENTALGTIELKNQGFAASDVFRRKWGSWHHLVSLEKKEPVTALLGCVAVASTAWRADQTTSALALSKPDSYKKISEVLNAEYLVLREEGLMVSEHWPGIVFT